MNDAEQQLVQRMLQSPPSEMGGTEGVEPSVCGAWSQLRSHAMTHYLEYRELLGTDSRTSEYIL